MAEANTPPPTPPPATGVPGRAGDAFLKLIATRAAAAETAEAAAVGPGGMVDGVIVVIVVVGIWSGGSSMTRI